MGDYGINAEHIPIEMGGSCPLEERFPEWLEERLQIELIRERQYATERETIMTDRRMMERAMHEKEVIKREAAEGSEAPAYPDAEEETGIPGDTV